MKLFSAPIMIKYRQWFTDKNQIFIKVGYSPYVTIGSQYETNYNLIIHHGYDADDNRTVSQLERVNGTRFYGGTASLSAGITRKAFASNKVELAIFYEKSLGTVGRENNNLQLAGLRTAFWWRVK